MQVPAIQRLACQTYGSLMRFSETKPQRDQLVGWNMVGEGKVTGDHTLIQQWILERKGKPVTRKVIRGTEILRVLQISFPDSAGQETLEEISWENFFECFEKEQLVFLYQEFALDGSLSRSYQFL